MKPYEQGGVVDSRLGVYGVKDLKVAGTVYEQFFTYTLSESENTCRLVHLPLQCRQCTDIIHSLWGTSY